MRPELREVLRCLTCCIKGHFQFIRKRTLVNRVRLLSADRCAARLDSQILNALTVSGPMITGTPPPLRSTRLLDQLRERLRYAHYSLSTERSYVYWVRGFIRFHGLRHPREMGGPEVESFLSCGRSRSDPFAVYDCCLSAGCYASRPFERLRVSRRRTCQRSRSDHLARFASLEIVRRFLRRRSSCRGVATPARSHIAMRSFDPAVATGAPWRFRSIGRSRSESETRRQARSCTRRGTSRRYR